MSSPPPQPSTKSLNRISMAFHDEKAIPLPSLPRLSTPLQTFITHLTLAHDIPLASSQLATLALNNPSTIPLIVLALRKHHFPHLPSALPSPQAPLLLQTLVRRVPYFYRYIAAPIFSRALRRLALSHSQPASRTKLLLTTWARDLAPLARAADPAAILWLATYRKAKRASNTPFPKPSSATFVCPVPVPVPQALPSTSHFQSPHGMPPAQVAATLRLIDQLILAAKRKERRKVQNTSPHNQRPPRRKRPPRGPAPLPNVNQKVLSVIRRHDDLFPADLVFPFDDSITTFPIGSDIGGSSGALSVAEVAKINARKKLSESQRSLTMSFVGPSEEDSTFETLRVDAEVADFAEEEDNPTVEKAITPSTFADIEIDEESGEFRNQVPTVDATEASVGDTVNLDGLELNSGDGNTSVGQKILKFMAAAMAKGDQGKVGPAHPEQGRSADGEKVRVSVGKVY